MPSLTMMMNSQGSGLDQYCSVDPAGELATGGGGGSDGGADGFLDMLGDRRSSGDLFDLVWQGGAGGGGGHLSLSPLEAVALPPSDDEMAAWLYPIVRDDELLFTDQDDHAGDLAGHAAATVNDHQAADHKREDKLSTEMEDKCRAKDSASLSLKATGGARKSHGTQTHNQTEKRRRCKINEKLKTLQQLVPGCDKRNQLSTLDQTIQYMKSLQQQIQAMSFGCGVKPPAAVYPVVAPPYLPPAAAAGLMPRPAATAPGGLVRGHVRPRVVLAQPPALVPFGPLVYPAAMASPPTLYPALAAAPNVSVAASSSQRH
ncbi:unnamed protein product [Urochloa humidicola]